MARRTSSDKSARPFAAGKLPSSPDHPANSLGGNKEKERKRKRMCWGIVQKLIGGLIMCIWSVFVVVVCELD